MSDPREKIQEAIKDAEHAAAGEDDDVSVLVRADYARILARCAEEFLADHSGCGTECGRLLGIVKPAKEEA